MQLSDLQKNSPKYEDEEKMIYINKTPQNTIEFQKKTVMFVSNLPYL